VQPQEVLEQTTRCIRRALEPVMRLDCSGQVLSSFAPDLSKRCAHTVSAMTLSARFR
jgi:hypothetical protein